MLRANWGRTAVGLVLASMIFTGAADASRWGHRFPANHVQYLRSLGLNLDAPIGLTGRVDSAPLPHRARDTIRPRSSTRRVGQIFRNRPRQDPAAHPRIWRAHRFERCKPTRVQFGDTIHAVARLSPPHTDQNPGSFNFRVWMEDIEDIYWVGRVSSSRQIEIVRHTKGRHIDEIIERTRQLLRRAIDDLYPGWSPEGRYGSVLKAVLWGDRAALDSTTLEDFRKTGHLSSARHVAGLHIGLITLLVELLPRRI